MSIQNIECKDSAIYNYAPVYLGCWGDKNLPSSIKAKAGPAYSDDPLANCPALGYPTTQIETTLTLVKTPGCGDGTNSVFWCGPAGTAQLCFYSIFPFIGFNASLADITKVYTVGSSKDIKGSCSFDPITKETHLTVTGTLMAEGANNFTCYIPFEIYYDGV